MKQYIQRSASDTTTTLPRINRDSVLQYRFRQYLSEYSKRTAKLRARSGYTPPAHASSSVEAVDDTATQPQPTPTDQQPTTDESLEAKTLQEQNPVAPPEKSKVLRALPETRRMWDAYFKLCHLHVHAGGRSLDSWLAEAAGLLEPNLNLKPKP